MWHYPALCTVMIGESIAQAAVLLALCWHFATDALSSLREVF